MIQSPDEKLKDRINKAIGNIRFIATKAKRASVLQATQKAEITVTLLNEFRQYVNMAGYRPELLGTHTIIKYDQETLTRIVQATMQADDVFNMLTHANKKKYDQEYRQVWNLLENLHTFLENIIKKGGNNATK